MTSTSHSIDDEIIPPTGLKVYAVNSSLLGNGSTGKTNGLTYDVLSLLSTLFGLLSSTYISKILEATVHDIKELQYEPSFNYVTGNLIHEVSKELESRAHVTSRGRANIIKGQIVRRSQSRSSSRSDGVPASSDEKVPEGRKGRPKSASSAQALRRKVLKSTDATSSLLGRMSIDVSNSFEEIRLDSGEFWDGPLNCYAAPAKFIHEWQGKALQVTWLGTRLLQQPSNAHLIELQRARSSELILPKREQLMMDLLRSQDEQRMKCFSLFLKSVGSSQSSLRQTQISFQRNISRGRERESSSAVSLAECRGSSSLGR